MKSNFPGQTALLLVGWTLVACYPESAFARQDRPDPNPLASLVEEIPLILCLYNKNEEKVKVESLPKYPPKKLAPFLFAEKDSAPQELKRFKANRIKYAKQFPLRASIFEAMELMDSLQALKLPMSLKQEEAKNKAFFLKQQGNVGVLIFKLEKAQDQLQEAEEGRSKETSKRWQAHLDFARARVETNLLYLYEYNYTLGQIRADNLPTLGKNQDGWIIAARPKIMVTESKAKGYAKARLKRLKQIQDDYADTPWVYFADRESRRDVGMEWTPKKK